MIDQAFRYRRGETVRVYLEAPGATDADLASLTAASAVLKRSPDGQTIPPPEVPAVATWRVERIAASQDVAPGFMFELSAEISAGLVPGVYVSTASLTIMGGTVDITEPVWVRIDEATS